MGCDAAPWFASDRWPSSVAESSSLSLSEEVSLNTSLKRLTPFWAISEEGTSSLAEGTFAVTVVVAFDFGGIDGAGVGGSGGASG